MAVRKLRPDTTEELLRDHGDRIRRLETATTVVIGSGTNAWVLEADEAGQLTARHAASGKVTVIAAP